MNNTTSRASVIIPAFNEEDFISTTLKELQKNPLLEIILVDNGSSDETAAIARALGVTVVDFPVGTIAAVRNRGVAEAKEDVLVFIDSDVRVTGKWHEKIPSVINTVEANPLMITGYRYQSPGNESFLNKYWYSRLSGYKAQYINGGNLITSRELFRLVGGFTEELETAEDYEFCLKAQKAGAVINEDSDLAVIHDGYPQTITGFIQRERWLGKQDVKNWRSFFESKIALVSALHLFVFLATLGVAIFGSIVAIPAYFIGTYVLLFILTMYKFGSGEIKYMLIMPLAYYLYIWGRTLSIVDRLFKINSVK